MFTIFCTIQPVCFMLQILNFAYLELPTIIYLSSFCIFGACCLPCIRLFLITKGFKWIDKQLKLCHWWNPNILFNIIGRKLWIMTLVENIPLFLYPWFKIIGLNYWYWPSILFLRSFVNSIIDSFLFSISLVSIHISSFPF